MARITKRAIIFSIASLLIVIVFVVSTQLVTEFRLAESELEVTRTRVKILNELIDDFEETYFDRLLYVTSKNTLEGLSEYYDRHYNNPSDYPHTLKKALNMTIQNGIYIDRTGKHNLSKEGCFGPCLKEDYTFNKLADSIKEEFDFLGIDLQINMKITEIEQVNPWTLSVSAEFEYYFKDKNNIASWKGFTERTVEVSIYGLHDPTSSSNPIDSSWIVDTNEDGEYTEASLERKLEGVQDHQMTFFDYGVCSGGC